MSHAAWFAKLTFIAYNNLMKELKPIEEKWNKKRLLILFAFLVLFLAGLLGIKLFVLDKNQSSPTAPKKSFSVKGAEIVTDLNKNTKDSTSGVKSGVSDQINTLKQEVSNINLAEVASSSPQVKKVLEDIKSLQNLPRNEVKDFCQKVCSGL